MLTASEEDLFDRFVAATKAPGAPSPEVIAEHFRGISGPTIRRFWRYADAGETPNRIQAGTLDAMTRFVTSYEEEGETLFRRLGGMDGVGGGPISGHDTELDRRISKILDDANLSVHEKSTLLLDVALALRAGALHERDRAARIEAELAARRHGTLTEVETHVMPKRRVTREDLERDRRTG